jgi:chromosome segregation ATPase
MGTPASAIPGYRQLSFRTLADLNAEREQLRADLGTARFRVAELEQSVSRLKDLIEAKRAVRKSLEARPNQPKARIPAIAGSALTADSLKNKLKSEKDPKERFRLQQRINALE